MGKLIKLCFLIVSALVLIFIIVGVFNGVSNINKERNHPRQSQTALPGIKEYEQIKVGDSKTGNGGMTISEVEHILGKPTSQTKASSKNVEMKVFTYAASNGPNSILVTYINGCVSGKTQTGLK